MKKQFTEEQIIYVLRQPTAEQRWRKYAERWATPEQTFYRCKKKFAGLGVAELRKLKHLQEQNQKLKTIVADLTLDKQMLQDVLRKMF